MIKIYVNAVPIFLFVLDVHKGATANIFELEKYMKMGFAFSVLSHYEFHKFGL